MRTIGVLMGGPSSEHDVSLMTGLNVLRGLESKYNAIPVFISLTGEWFVGRDRRHMPPQQALRVMDAVFNAMHGEYGEDGKVQALLESAKIPYSGSGVLASALAMHKEKAGDALRKAGLMVPRTLSIEKSAYRLSEIGQRAREFSAPPWVVKPARRGSSVGVSIAKHVGELAEAFTSAFRFDDLALLQEYIAGRELTCGIIEQFNGEKYFALPPVEIRPPKEEDFFSYAVKYNGKTKEICPTDFHDAMLAHIRATAVAAHVALGCRHYSRTDMILKGTKLYVLEVNTLPGLTNESLLPKAARAAGLEFPQLLDHIVDLTLS